MSNINKDSTRRNMENYSFFDYVPGNAATEYSKKKREYDMEILILIGDENAWVGRYGSCQQKDRNAPYKRPDTWDVYHNGERIGKVIYDSSNRYDSINKCSYKEYYYGIRIVDGTDRDSYVSGEYKTLYAAKFGVLEAYKKCDRQTRERKAEVKYLPAMDSEDFYPTPSALAGAMLRLIDWNNARSILEPSAGKGDLLDSLMSFKNNNHIKIGREYLRYEMRLDVDCIELDTNLQYILNGKGYRVVHDDFLSYNTRKRYDLIIANPPFSEGDKHLIKMLQMQESGGQIVCILNAETIRNPYTNLRKALSSTLAKYGAKIEFIKNAFARAERSSDVEIALVYVNIPCKTFESDIWNRMKAAREKKVEGPEEIHDLAPNSFIERLIREYEIEVDASLSFMREFNALLPHIMNGSDSYSKPLIELKIDDHDVYKSAINNESVNNYMRAVRRKYWHELLSDQRIVGKLTSTLQKQYSDSVERMSDYDFSEFNIMQVVCEINSKLSIGVHGAIMSLFDEMSAKHSWYPECESNIHYFTGWASNKAHKINAKVILPINGFSSYSWDKNKLDTYHIHGTITDIEKVLDYLDGGKTCDCHTWGFIQQAASKGQTKDIHCKYFSVAFYKKGTCHIKFHEQRIVDILNIYGARMRGWLPPSYGRKHYKDMEPEAQAVVNEFQGSEAYENVMQNSEEYIIEAAQVYKALPEAV